MILVRHNEIAQEYPWKFIRCKLKPVAALVIILCCESVKTKKYLTMLTLRYS